MFFCPSITRVKEHFISNQKTPEHFDYIDFNRSRFDVATSDLGAYEVG